MDVRNLGFRVLEQRGYPCVNYYYALEAVAAWGTHSSVNQVDRMGILIVSVK